MLARLVIVGALVATSCGGSGPVVRITNEDPLPDGIAGRTYTVTFTAEGGGDEREWTGVEVPFGAVDEEGVFTGTPPEAGSYEITVRVDAGRPHAERTFHFEIYEPLVSGLDDPPYLVGGDGVVVSSVVAGGKTPYLCEVLTDDGVGAPPEGVSLDPSDCSLSGDASGAAPGSYGMIVLVRDELGQTVEVPVFLAGPACSEGPVAASPAEAPPRIEAPGAEYEWSLEVSDMDVPCLPPDCPDCQVCYGIQAVPSDPLTIARGYNCDESGDVCSQCGGCIEMDNACPGTATMSPTVTIQGHARIREGAAWVTVDVELDYTGDDPVSCTGKRWDCRLLALEI